MRFDFGAKEEAAIQLAGGGAGSRFTVFTSNPVTTRFWSRSYRADSYVEALDRYEGNRERNIYVTQHQFKYPNRKKLSVCRLCTCFVDLDVYKSEGWAGSHVWEVIEAVLGACERMGWPLPSAILSSGGGLYAKWYLTGEEACRMVEWDGVQRSLVRGLAEFGADKGARDASRVLRMLGTVNQKNGRSVEALWLNGVPGDVKVHEFSEMVEKVGMSEEIKVRIKKASLKKEGEKSSLKCLEVCEAEEPDWLAGQVSYPRSEASLSELERRWVSFSRRGWNVLSDLVKLANLRGWDATGLPDGMRDKFVFWLVTHGLLALMGACKPDVYQEVVSLVKSLVPHWSWDRIRNVVSAAYIRAKGMDGGFVWRRYHGKDYPLQYTPSNALLIEQLEIEEKELVLLDYIRSKASEAAQRMRKRRESGAVSREEYLAKSLEKRGFAVKLREEGMSLRAIARELGMSLGCVQNLLL